MRKAAGTSDLLLAALGCSLIVTSFLLMSDAFQHWFAGPLLVCGTLIGSDLVAWIRRRELIFDPAGMLSVMGFHLFFLAPLFLVLWSYHMPYLEGQPDDWRECLGTMSILNAVGLFLYRWVRDFIRRKAKPSLTYRRLDHRQFPTIITGAIVLCTLFQLYIYIAFGGIRGFVNRYLTGGEAWQDTGWMFVIAECAPILAMLALAVRLRKSKQRPGWPVLTVVLAAFFVVQLMFGALRGSRMNTIICVFWAAGIIHYWLRPIGRNLMLSGIALLLIFMYFAAFYKDAGLEALTAFDGTVERDILTAKTHRTMQGVIIGDLSRSDVQAFTVYRLRQARPFDFAWGRTYVGALALLIPRPLWSNRPPTKAKWTTELEYDTGTYGIRASSRVYGIVGELMLNFGYLAAPVGPLILGVLVGTAQRFIDSAHPQDCRLLLLPIMICFCISAMMLDSDNMVYFVVKYAAIPGAIIMFASRTVNLPGAARASRRGAHSRT